MNIKEILYYVLDAFKRINRYAYAIYDPVDEELKDIIMSICTQEIKAVEYELDQIKLQGDDE